MMRKRKIWAEGSFAVMKREHNLLKIRKRGILTATEECLLSAMALNLKRMAKAIFSAIYPDKMWAETMIPQPIFYLCQTIFYKGIMPSEKVLDLPMDCNTLTGSVNL